MGGGTAAVGVGAWRAACACILLLCGRIVAAQGGGVENVRFRNYATEHGLSQLTVRAIAQTTPGYLWFGTQDGLNRFDGYSFRVYRHDGADPASLPDNHVFALAGTTDGALWVAGQTGGLARYDPQIDGFVRYARVPGDTGTLASDRITALRVDRRGVLWIGTREGALQRLAPGAAARFETHALAGAGERGGPVRALHERADGSMLVGAEHGLWHCSAAGDCAREWRDGDEPLDVYALAESGSGEVWVATAREGLVRFDVEGRAIGRVRTGEGGGDGLAHDDTRALLFDARGRLWVGTDRGLSRFDSVEGPVRTWLHEAAVDDSLASNRVYALFEGREQLVWVGTWLNGVSMFDPRTEAFGELRSEAGNPATLPTGVVRAVAADADGTLWLGLLEGGGLVHFDPARGVIARYTHDPDDPDSLSSNNVQYITRARDGALWIGTNGGGLDRLRPEGGFEHFRRRRAD
ncbi:MAG TPA: two-component regulator propeller domain-containing protein, partial [Xanthomonadales bacterium]|nr:two-component regulator propeller domain-containing protein [Xanthomonadales bacterium]